MGDLERWMRICIVEGIEEFYEADKAKFHCHGDNPHDGRAI